MFFLQTGFVKADPEGGVGVKVKVGVPRIEPGGGEYTAPFPAVLLPGGEALPRGVGIPAVELMGGDALPGPAEEVVLPGGELKIAEPGQPPGVETPPGQDPSHGDISDGLGAHNIPIRIGVNGGSLEKHILAKYGAAVPEAMVESALYHVRLLEKFDFYDTVISIKSSNVPRMMEAYRQLSEKTDYPLHVGVTEAGTYQMGLLKSGMGIGGMLLEGIGDTIRVSLAAEPEKEVEAGFNILRAVGFPVGGPEVITCPTCGRTQYPCTEIANEVEKRLRGYKKSIKVAVMGCVVNGPGEAREADIGIAGGKGEALLFVHGQPVRKLTGENILDQFMEEIYKL